MKNKRQFRLSGSLASIATVLAVALLSRNAYGQLIATENFNYSTGTGIAAQGVPGSGASGWQPQAVALNPASGYWQSKSDPNPTTEIQAGSLNYTDGSGNTLNTSAGSMVSQTTTSTTSEPQIMTTSTFGALGVANTAAAGTLWVSYLWQGLNTTGSGSGLYRQSIMMFLTGATSTGSASGSERLDVGMPNISAVNQSTVNPRISLWTAGGSLPNTFSSTAPLQSGVAANNGITDFILMEFVLDNTTTTADTVNVWINPTLGVYTTGALGTPNLTYAAQDLSAINGLRLQSGSENGTDGTVGGQQQVDEINIGDTAQDVENFTPEPAPEPASMTLASLGGAAALLVLRRKRA